MKKQHIAGVAVSVLLGGVTLFAAPAANAQGQAGKALPPITLDLRDAPIRQALDQLFTNANVQFSIDNNVAGFITLKIQDQPFENALRLIMRASSVPLTYNVENGVYFVKPRPLGGDAVNATAPPPQVITPQTQQYLPLEQIQLTYLDAYDLQGLLKVIILPGQQRTSVALRGGSGGAGGGLGGGIGGAGGGGIGGAGGGLGGAGGGIGGGGGGLGGGIGGGLGGGGGIGGGGLGR